MYHEQIVWLMTISKTLKNGGQGQQTAQETYSTSIQHNTFIILLHVHIFTVRAKKLNNSLRTLIFLLVILVSY